MPAAPVARDRSAIEAALARHIGVLASDDFGGRQPGTEGEAKTLRYLAREWQAAGLESGTNDPANPWFAPVALSQSLPDKSVARFYRDGRPIALPDPGVAPDGPLSAPSRCRAHDEENRRLPRLRR